MPKTLLKRCCKCDRQIVRVGKEFWRWAKRNVRPTEEDPDLGKPICGSKECRPGIEAMSILYPYSVWEVTETGFRRTLVDAPNR